MDDDRMITLDLSPDDPDVPMCITVHDENGTRFDSNNATRISIRAKDHDIRTAYDRAIVAADRQRLTRFFEMVREWKANYMAASSSS